MSGLFGGGGSVAQIAPRITGMQMQTSVYGRAIPICFGTRRLSANLGWYGDFKAVAHSQSTGGKGGGGGGSVTSYTYQAAVDFMLCEGPIVGISRVWRDKDIITETNQPAQTITVYDEETTIPAAPFQVTVANAANFIGNIRVNMKVSGVWFYCSQVSGTPSSSKRYSVANGVYTFYSGDTGNKVRISYEYTEPAVALSALTTMNATLFTGVQNPSPPGYMTTNHAAEALGYQYTAHVFSNLLQLTNSATLNNYTWEIQGYNIYSGRQDANPKDALYNYLIDPNYGTGFPAANIGDLTQFSNYCLAQSLLLSPLYTEQSAAADHIKALLTICNSAAVWSQGLLKIVPYGDTALSSALGSYTPNVTPIYDLTDDDFLPNGDDGPVIVVRPTALDAFNSIQVEYTDRDADYNLSRAEASDIVSVRAYGYRPAPALTDTGICQASVAQTVSQTALQRILYIRAKQSFKLSLKYSLLEPMDIVTLSDLGIGYSQAAVRILSIEEDGNGELTVEAEEFPLGAHTPALYATQSGGGYLPNFNVDPGNTNPPTIIEPTDLLVSSGQLWLQASGVGPNWGGCNVWVSTDNATYKMVGTITGNGRQGLTTAALPLAASPDLTNTLRVQLNASGVLASGSEIDQASLHTLVSVDNEFVAYLEATLTGVNAYDLSNLLRGVGGSVIAAHGTSAGFARWDGTQLAYEYPDNVIGLPLYLKLQSFNQYGGGTQTLDTLASVTYTVQGTFALRTPPDVTGVVQFSQNGLSYVGWTAPSEVVDGTEVRFGSSWVVGMVLGQTVAQSLQVNSNGTYWMAHKRGNTYSANPVSIAVTTVANPVNIVQTWDEAATGWTGALSGAAQLVGAGTIVELTNTGGVVNTPGWYEVPAGHIVDLGTVQTATVGVNYAATTDSPNALFSAIPLVSAAPSIAGNWAGLGAVTIQIATSDAAGTFGAWATFVPGQYSGRKFKIRAQLVSLDSGVTPALTGLNWTVDMQDKIDRSNTGVACAVGGTAYTWATPFQIVPNVHVAITNMAAGDTITYPVAATANGVTVKILNGGVGVARNINIIASGY